MVPAVGLGKENPGCFSCFEPGIEQVPKNPILARLIYSASFKGAVLAFVKYQRKDV